MRNFRLAALVFLLLFTFVVGCSNGGNTQSPVSPGTEGGASVPAAAASGTTSLISLWQVTVNKEAGMIEAVDMRSSNLITNVLGFLEPPALSGMSIDFGTLHIDGVNNIVNVDVILKHPINNPVFMGFDVRGVVFGPDVTNADGYTVIPSPEFFKDVPFGYQDGLLGVPDSVANYEGLAGYKYFCSGLGNDDDLVTFMSVPGNLVNRGVFPNGATLRRHYDLSWAETSPPITLLVFNYAIYANYNWPTGDPPIDINDFDIVTANSAEAFCIKVEETANSLWYSNGSGGGTLNLQVEVWDWQGDVNAVSAKSVDPGALPVANGTYAGPGSTAKSGYWDIVWTTSNPTTTGDLDILITVTDSKSFGQAWFGDLLPTTNSMYTEPVYNCWTYAAKVIPSTGWARTWGGSSGYDYGYGVATDGSGNVYVTGYFWGTVDFDPGTGVDNHTSNGGYDVFLSKFDSSGNYLWAKTWGGGSGYDCGYGVATDGSGNVYATGYFIGTVDFDPGTGVDDHTSNGGYDVFLSKFDSSGNYLWARTWGGSDHDYGYGVATDGSGNVYATGYFYGTVDFDPGTGVDKHTSSDGSLDVFLSKFDSSGGFLWARTWDGAPYSDSGQGVTTDASGNIYVTGLFEGTTDFDPGLGVDNHTSNGYYDAYLSKFDSTGAFLWARTWGGGSGYDGGSSVATDASGNAYVTGSFIGTVDFDPGTGVDNHTSNGWSYDAFLSKFDSSGGFVWAKTWGGGPYSDGGQGVTTDASGNAYVTGFFYGTVNFDPGTGVDDHTSNGVYDVFLSKFDSSGNYLWAKTWGGTYDDRGYSVATDGSGNAFVTGYFSETVDFDPGTDVDEHTSNGYYDVFLSKFLPDGSW